MLTIQFQDKLVSYDTFLRDLTARLAKALREDKADPEYLSQRQAYRLFGRANVDRWRRNLMVTPRKRPGKIEYPTAQLRTLQRTQQDYFTR